MKLSLYFFALIVLTSFGQVQAQGTYYSVKGGLTVGTQQWNNFERDPLLGYHGIVSMESIPQQGLFSLFAQVGYHVKGSAIRRSLFGSPFNAGFVALPPDKFEFYNISLTIGAKQRFSEVGNGQAYYLFGIRGDYTVDTNLDQYEDFRSVNTNAGIVITRGTYPLDVYYTGETLLGVRRINYGLTVGGGIEFPFSEFVGGIVEFTVNPDFSLQYQQPAIPNAINPFNPNSTRTIGERNIRNLTFEVTVGFRFLRKVEYVK